MINSKNIYTELIAIADNEIERIEKSLPDDPSTCFVLLIEITRVYDYLHFGQKEEIKKYGLSFQEINVLKYGWNLATSFLFKSVKHFPGIPVMESTKETRISAISFLYQLGTTILLKRTAEMVKSGILIGDKKDNYYTFSMSSEGKSQYLDAMEPSYMETLENKLNDHESEFYKNWKLVGYDDLVNVMNNYGNFLSKNPKDPFSNLRLDDIKKKMSPLIKPWNSGKGVMIGYDSTEEIDWHFMAIATSAIKEWRDDAGLHPDIRLDDITISDIIKVVLCLVSFNLKHIEFSSIAAEEYKEISIPQSLTIWCPLSDLINDISDFAGMDREIVAKVFQAISLKATDSILLREHTSLFMPLIIDLENNFVLRPVSSILRNPLNTIKDLLTLRNPKIISEFSKNRESWLRDYLYAMFMGTRYHRITGNINLRINKKNITDIDAAIYDNTTGELALFQIKWQDYHYNDVKKLRSKASNLTKELDNWTRKVSEWIATQGVEQLEKNLRLTARQKISVSKIYLFGLSKDAARMMGYGFELKEKKIAVGTFSQFKRNRTEIGPSKRVFNELFDLLKEQENIEIDATPRPVTFKISNKEFHYKDLWSTVED